MPFDAVAETLLRGGIAPRHVRRYLGELSDHLEDLTQRQRNAGYDESDATIRARALLGDDRELSAAMLENKAFRSWTARLPWLFFVPLPFLALTVTLVALAFPIMLIGDGATHIHRLTGISPDLLRGISRASLAGLNMLGLPLLAILLGFAAHRQRLGLFWPLTGIALLLVLFPHSGMEFADGVVHKTAELKVTVMPLFMPKLGDELFEQAPVILGQWLLTGLAIAWLLHKRHTCAPV